MKNFKKLPRKQLEKFSTIFTQLGLVLVLFVVYISLEHKTEEKKAIVFEHEDSKIAYFDPSTEIIFTKEVKVTPNIKVVKTPPFIVDAPIDKGDNTVIETVIDLPSEKDPEIIDINTVVTIVEKPTFNDEDEVPYILIQDAPVFKGCEGLSKEENKACFDTKMKKFVQRNFDADLANELGLQSGKHRIQTQFIINKDGNVVDVKIRAPHKKLKQETDRLIKKLPKFTPGKQRNKPVKVRYTLPITFNVQ
jgi:protein TonB